MNEFLGVKDIMRILKVSRPTAYLMVSSGRLKSYKVGRLVRIKAEDLERFIESRPSENKSKREK